MQPTCHDCLKSPCDISIPSGRTIPAALTSSYQTTQWQPGQSCESPIAGSMNQTWHFIIPWPLMARYPHQHLHAAQSWQGQPATQRCQFRKRPARSSFLPDCSGTGSTPIINSALRCDIYHYSTLHTEGEITMKNRTFEISHTSHQKGSHVLHTSAGKRRNKPPGEAAV